MLKFMALSRDLLGEDLYHHDWWMNTARYRLYLALPRNAWTRQGSVVDIADCPRSNWYGPDYMLRALAHEFQDGQAQWLADQVDQSKTSSPEATWLGLLWYDPDVKPVPPTGLPTLRHFTDMDIVSTRTGWSGNESLLVFKCGPYIGHKGVHEFSFDPGGGHVHPDANHFVLFGDGEWLIRDDGYRAKSTAQHNTLLVDGQGQTGEGSMWFNGASMLKPAAEPRVQTAHSTPAIDTIAGDATAAYPVGAGLKRYVRHLLFLKPDVLIVADDIETTRDADLELRFHPEQQKADQDGAALLFRGRTSLLRLETLAPDGATTAAGVLAGVGRDGEAPLSLYTVQLKTHAHRWRTATALSWSAAAGTPPHVTLETNGSRWTFTAAGRSVTLEWEK
jgi:hypothetical protein